MASKPLPDFIGDGPEQAVTQCCEDCVRLHTELLAAERRYGELAVLVQGQVYSRALARLLARHYRERKESSDEASK